MKRISELMVVRHEATLRAVSLNAASATLSGSATQSRFVRRSCVFQSMNAITLTACLKLEGLPIMFRCKYICQNPSPIGVRYHLEFMFFASEVSLTVVVIAAFTSGSGCGDPRQLIQRRSRPHPRGITLIREPQLLPRLPTRTHHVLLSGL